MHILIYFHKCRAYPCPATDTPGTSSKWEQDGVPAGPGQPMLGDESRLRYWASSDAAMAGNLSLKGLPLCAMLTKIGKVFMKPFFFS